MPEVCLTQLETEVLSVFVRHKILKDDDIARDLRILIEKLKIAEERGLERIK